MGILFIPQGLVVPQGYALKALEPIGHLLAIDSTLSLIGFTLFPEVGGLLPVICGVKLRFDCPFFTITYIHSYAIMCLPQYKGVNTMTKKMDISSFKLAQHFMKNHARPLERALYEYEFEATNYKKALQELIAFQNPDGGFGHGLEPDLRCNESSALATTYALGILGELPAFEEKKNVVCQALDYFITSYQDDHTGWDIIPVEAERSPRAIWWQYGVFSDNWGNPNADIVGFFIQYRDLVTYEKLDMLIDYAIQHLLETCDLAEMHELFCYLRLYEQLKLNTKKRTKIEDRLQRFINNCVIADPAKREGYVAGPLQIIDSPKSTHYRKFANILPMELDHLIGQQATDGAWAPNWEWHQYENDWPIAEKEWKGILTLQALRILRNFKYLPI